MDDIQPLLFYLVAGLTGLCAIATVVTQNIVRCATWLLFTLAGTSAIFFLLGADFVGAVQLLVYVGGTLVLVVFGVMLTAQGPFINMRTSGVEWAISILAGGMLLGVLAFGILRLNHSARAVEEALAKNTPQEEEVDAKAKDHEHGGAKGHGALAHGEKQQEPFRQTLRLTPPKDSTLAQYASKETDFEYRARLAKEAADKGETLPSPAQTSHSSTTIGQAFLGVGLGPAHLSRDDHWPIRMHYLLPFELVSVHLLVVLIGAAYLARSKRRRGADA